MKKIIDQVKSLLERYPDTRNDDMYLYMHYMREQGVAGASDVYKVLAVPEQRYMHGVKGFESISRARRKIQHDFPELQATIDKRAFRREMEQKYREFYNSQSPF